MNIDDLRRQGLIIFEAISGSKAFGLDTPESDTDIRGVFIMPKSQFFGFSEIEQVANSTNDIVFYELKKFMMLLKRNNPNILEMLYTPNDCILSEHPLFTKIKNYNFLSTLCRDTFVRYAMTQIKKARGLNKKIVNPMPVNRLGVLDFCYVTSERGSRPLKEWLSDLGLHQENCGLAGLNNFPGVYLIYSAKDHPMLGIVSDELNSNDVRTSSIPKSLNPMGYLYFNMEAYKAHCKNHKEYWAWVKHRNESRYKTNIDHGKNYDSKNMMHVFRLLGTAEDIAKNKIINLRGHDRDFLLRIKSGHYQYDELISLAEKKTQKLDKLFEHSSLPKTPNHDDVERLLIETRKNFYR